MKKKVHIKTWGCQMNVYDSSRMMDLLSPLGYEMTESLEESDLILLNTCHIREKATEKLFSELGRLKTLQADHHLEGKRLLIGVAGCVAQAEGEEIQRRAPFVDMVFGPQSYQHLPEMIARLNRGSGALLNTEFPLVPKFDTLPTPEGNHAVSQFLSIQEGCDKFCTFCVVPYTRGAEYSRPVKDILIEAQKLIQNGAKELTLLGQNVNAYHGLGENGKIVNLAELLFLLSENPGIKRLRYTTSHPKDMDEGLLLAHRDNQKLMPFLHLPVQSGSNSVLKAMNRNHTRDAYQSTIDRLRHYRPDIALSSDFIVGFPSETDADFNETMELVRQTTFAQAYSFKYSPRPGTPAAALPQLNEAIKDARLQELQALLSEQQLKFNQETVGQSLPVLCEAEGRKDGQIYGKTPYGQTIHFPSGRSLIGEELTVKVVKAGPTSVLGEVERLPFSSWSMTA